MSHHWQSLAGLMVSVAVMVGAIHLAFPEHLDYAAHFSTGAGMTLGGLAVVLMFVHRPEPALVVGLVMAAIAVGALAEATVFRLAAFDWVDFALQSSGATLAAFPFLNGGSIGRNVAAIACALLLVGIGISHLLWISRG